MRMFGYYILHTFINQIRKLCKTWVIILILVCGLMGGLIGFGAAVLFDDSETYEDELDENGDPTGVLIGEDGGRYIEFYDINEDTLIDDYELYQEEFKLQKENSGNAYSDQKGHSFIVEPGKDGEDIGILRDEHGCAFILCTDLYDQEYAVPFNTYFMWLDFYDDELDYDLENERLEKNHPLILEFAEDAAETEEVEEEPLYEDEEEAGFWIDEGLHVMDDAGNEHIYSWSSLLEAIALVIAAVLVLFLVFGADKGGGKMFLMADVNLLFSSPLKPQTILLFRLMTKLGSMLFLMIYFGVIYMPTLVGEGVLGGWQEILLFTTLFFVIGYGVLLQVLIYILGSNTEGIGKKVHWIIYAFCIAMLAGFAVFWKSSGTVPLVAAVEFFQLPALRILPILGWAKGFVYAIMSADMAAGLLWGGLLVIGMVILVSVIWRIKADFYEDAMTKSEEVADLLRQTQERGGLFAARKKDQTEKDKKKTKKRQERPGEGFTKGEGAAMYFYKAMHIRYRFARLHYFTKSCLFYLGAAVVLCVYGKVILQTDLFLPGIMGLGGFVFFRSMGNPLEEDVHQDMFRMIPESTAKKLFYSLLGAEANCFLDILPAVVLITIVFGQNPIYSILWVLVILTVNLYATCVGAFMDATIPINQGVTIKQMVQVMFVYFGLIPDAGILAVGIVFDHIVAAVIVTIFVNCVITLIFIILTANFLEPKEGKTRIRAEGHVDHRYARSRYSRIAFAALLYYLVGSIMQLLVVGIIGESLEFEQPAVMFLVTFLPLHLVGFPAAYFLIRKLPVSQGLPENRESFGPGRLVKIFPMMVTLTYAGIYIGNVLNMALIRLVGHQSDNVLEAYVTEDSLLWQFLILVIAGPIMEEIFCRKMIIDRVRIFGEKRAVIFSALVFGLFHGNLSQSIYAFALGLVLGYVYLRSEKLRYSIALHMAFNFMGSVISGTVARAFETNIEALGDLITDDTSIAQLFEIISKDPFHQCRGIILYGVYMILLLTLLILGAIFLILERKNIRFYETKEQLSDKEGRILSWANPGMIVYTLVMMAMMAVVIFRS